MGVYGFAIVAGVVLGALGFQEHKEAHTELLKGKNVAQFFAQEAVASHGGDDGRADDGGHDDGDDDGGL